MTTLANIGKAPAPLSQKKLVQSTNELASRDADLAKIVEQFGLPPMWRREPGFHTLILIILEQQVSLASAKAAYERLTAVASPLTPETFLRLDDSTLRSIGFSRQKTAYGRNLAEAIIRGQLDLAELAAMDDEAARSKLMRVKGIGNWTASIYLLMVLLRPDVWPSGDLALYVAMQRVKRLEGGLSPRELDLMSEQWRPWRSVAARILWHFYLSDKASRTASGDIIP